MTVLTLYALYALAYGVLPLRPVTSLTVYALYAARLCTPLYALPFWTVYPPAPAFSVSRNARHSDSA